jgi:hypothetical protein
VEYTTDCAAVAPDAVPAVPVLDCAAVPVVPVWSWVTSPAVSRSLLEPWGCLVELSGVGLLLALCSLQYALDLLHCVCVCMCVIAPGIEEKELGFYTGIRKLVYSCEKQGTARAGRITSSLR